VLPTGPQWRTGREARRRNGIGKARTDSHGGRNGGRAGRPVEVAWSWLASSIDGRAAMEDGPGGPSKGSQDLGPLSRGNAARCERFWLSDRLLSLYFIAKVPDS
jgi:hypothetical protein